MKQIVLKAVEAPSTVREAYIAIRKYFNRPNAVLAKADGATCKYRTDDGDKCAVGCLIPDAIYSQSFEGKGLSALVNALGSESPFAQLVSFGEENGVYDFLRMAQLLHDESADDAQDFVRLLDAAFISYELMVEKKSSSSAIVGKEPYEDYEA